jgi:DNA helicase MCM8
VYPKIKMNDVKTSVSNHFLSLRGHVTKVRPKRLRVVASLVQCTKCGLEFDHVFQDGRYTLPTKCEGMKCRATRNFSLVRSTARFVDVQEIKLQEAQDETTGAEAGRQPRHILVELQGADLVDSCHAGDIVRVSGTVRAVNSAFAAGKTGKRAMETSTYQLYITANSIQLEALSSSSTPKDDSSSSGEYNAKRARQDVGGEGSAPDGTGSSSAISFGADRLQAIVQLSHADHRMFDLGTRMAFPFDLLVRSICPSIIGHDMVKAGILLALLGGTPPAVEVKAKKSNQFSIRTNSHVLIVGDPGMGKVRCVAFGYFFWL